MYFDEMTNRLTLSTGRILSVYGGIFGMPLPNGEPPRVYCGYDNKLYVDEDCPLTSAERREIAEVMVRRWRAWAEDES